MGIFFGFVFLLLLLDNKSDLEKSVNHNVKATYDPVIYFDYRGLPKVNFQN